MIKKLLFIALAASFNSAPLSAQTDPRAVAFATFGSYVALGSLHSLIQKPLICEAEKNSEDEITTSDKVIRQLNRILEKASALWTLGWGAIIAVDASSGHLPGNASKANPLGSALGTLTMCTGYYLLKTQPSLICRKQESFVDNGYSHDKPRTSRPVRQINRILGKAGALGLIVLGAIMVINPRNIDR